jgi:hypothetical protein
MPNGMLFLQFNGNRYVMYVILSSEAESGDGQFSCMQDIES